MLSFEEMPEDNAELAETEIEFPRLDPDSSASCPVPLKDVVAYLRMESPDFDAVEESQLEFLRTALVAERHYWIWSFTESDGTACYVTVNDVPGGGHCIGYDSNDHGLTPEQFLLGDYHVF